MPRRGILFAVVAMLACFGAGQAQEGLSARLSNDRLGDIRPGTYSASNGLSFTIDRYAGRYLMHVASEPETYVLYADHASLGGLVLKFDSGGTALRVSGWGAVTVYTDAQPGGLPAERTADSARPALKTLSLAEMQSAAADEGEHLAYARNLHIAFSADWSELSADANLRALAFDALQNAARGIDRFAAIARGRAALIGALDQVHLTFGGRPTIELRGRTLVVTFVPAQGFAGRASSHGIARALGQLFAVPTAG